MTLITINIVKCFLCELNLDQAKNSQNSVGKNLRLDNEHNNYHQIFARCVANILCETLNKEIKSNKAAILEVMNDILVQKLMSSYHLLIDQA